MILLLGHCVLKALCWRNKVSFEEENDQSDTMGVQVGAGSACLRPVLRTCHKDLGWTFL